MLKKSLLILSLAMALSCNIAAASPFDTLDDLLHESAQQVYLDTNGIPSHGKVVKGNRPSNSLCEIGMFELDRTSIVNFKLSNKADDGIVYYKLAKHSSTNNIFDNFEAGNYTVVLPRGKYFLKTEFLSLDSGADAKYKSQITAVDIPETHSYIYNYKLSNAYALDFEEEIVKSFFTGSEHEKAHYYKFSITEKVQSLNIFAKLASDLGSVSFQILDTEGTPLANELHFNDNNVIDKTYKIYEGDYILKVKANDSCGAAYYFRIA